MQIEIINGCANADANSTASNLRESAKVTLSCPFEREVKWISKINYRINYRIVYANKR